MQKTEAMYYHLYMYMYVHVHVQVQCHLEVIASPHASGSSFLTDVVLISEKKAPRWTARK